MSALTAVSVAGSNHPVIRGWSYNGVGRMKMKMGAPGAEPIPVFQSLPRRARRRRGRVLREERARKSLPSNLCGLLSREEPEGEEGASCVRGVARPCQPEAASIAASPPPRCRRWPWRPRPLPPRRPSPRRARRGRAARPRRGASTSTRCCPSPVRWPSRDPPRSKRCRRAGGGCVCGGVPRLDRIMFTLSLCN